MLLIDTGGRIFLGERHGNPGVWQFPQGGEEPGVSQEENVIRELHEELGAAPECFVIIKKLDAFHQYDFRKTPEYAIGKWRGQRQSFWLVRFIGKESDIKLDRYQPEFMGYRWCSLDEVQSLADPVRLTGYTAPLSELRRFLADGG